MTIDGLRDYPGRMAGRAHLGVATPASGGRPDALHHFRTGGVIAMVRAVAAMFSLTAGFAAAAVVGRECLTELQLSGPTPYRVTLGRRLGVLGSYSAPVAVKDPISAEPFFRQVAGAVRRAIAEGSLEPGDRLPSGKELAQALGVNPHTVLRGYAVLQEEGLVEMGRGRGVRVAGGATVSSARLRGLAEALVAEARRCGIDADEAAGLVRQAMA
ncbi:MAG: GntR family transcriptional regulator [Acidimicrobiales bacterium]